MYQSIICIISITNSGSSSLPVPGTAGPGAHRGGDPGGGGALGLAEQPPVERKALLRRVHHLPALGHHRSTLLSAVRHMLRHTHTQHTLHTQTIHTLGNIH